MKKTVVGIGAGLASTILLGYWFFRDRLRRRSPQGELSPPTNLIRIPWSELRDDASDSEDGNEGAAGGGDTSSTGSGSLDVYCLSKGRGKNKLFLQELRWAEEMTELGNHEQAVEHLRNALNLCDHPARLLALMEEGLPSEVFTLLMAQYQLPPGHSPYLPRTGDPPPAANTPPTATASEAFEPAGGAEGDASSIFGASTSGNSDGSRIGVYSVHIRPGFEEIFVKEMDTAEQLTEQGQIQEAAMHLRNAVDACEEPARLLLLIKRELPKDVYIMLRKLYLGTISHSGSLGAVNPGGEAGHDDYDEDSEELLAYRWTF